MGVFDNVVTRDLGALEPFLLQQQVQEQASPGAGLAIHESAMKFSEILQLQDTLRIVARRHESLLAGR